MYEVGMYGGSFNPLHLGHVNDIIMAANQCKKLYIDENAHCSECKNKELKVISIPKTEHIISFNFIR